MQTESLGLNLTLSAFEPPKVSENRARGWVTIGERNQFFEDLIKKKNNSPTQKSISKTIADLITGDGFSYDESNAAIKAFLEKINTKGETGNQVLKKAAKDLANCAGRAYQIIWANDGKTIAEVYHQKFTTVRPGLMNEDEEIETYYLCRDWSKIGTYKPQPIPAFNPAKARQEPRQLFVAYEESDETPYFPLPGYAVNTPYMELEYELAKLSHTTIQKKLRLGSIVWVKKNLDDDATKRRQFKEDFKKSFHGPEADEVMFVFDDAPEMGIEITKLDIQNGADQVYESIDTMLVQKICTGNRVTSPVIAGLSGGASLGGDGNEISVAYEYFMNMVVKPLQNDIIEDFTTFLKYRKGAISDTNTVLGKITKLFSTNKKGSKNQPPLTIANTMPVQFKWSENVMEQILTDDELRAEIGYDPLDAQQEKELNKTDPDKNPKENEPAPKADKSGGAAE